MTLPSSAEIWTSGNATIDTMIKITATSEHRNTGRRCFGVRAPVRFPSGVFLLFVFLSSPQPWRGNITRPPIFTRDVFKAALTTGIPKHLNQPDGDRAENDNEECWQHKE